MHLQIPHASILSCSVYWNLYKDLGGNQYFLGSVLMLTVGYRLTGDTCPCIHIWTIGAITPAAYPPPSG